ncbi:MAG: choice-of-anchor J domain-containing protein [Bacteroides sp.]|nr:choice-of-anchor J domain-containing protein [Ruminococcus flavefaciens]MCM1554872.1 choice-of-anchor J domain-containing protein [Bacteroides sp.]
MKNWMSGFLLALAFAGMAASVCAQNVAPAKPEVKSIRDDKVSLAWGNTEQIYGILDGFEDHKDFAVNSPGKLGWSYWDMDNDRTYAIGSYVYENVGAAMAFQVWVPSKAIPAYTDEKGLPHSGDRCLISMGVYGDQRNDWLISPDLETCRFGENPTLSFWARSLSGSYGLESIKIAYSTTDMAVSSFTFLNNGESIEIPESSADHPDMYYFSYTIPKEARYVAINCVTNGGQALLIDDIAIATNKLMPNKAANYLTGFNLYRDGVKVNGALIDGHAYEDVVPAYGRHEYQLEAVYQGGEPVKGEVLEVDVPNIHLLPFIETFNTYSFETNFWEVSCPEGEADCGWKPGYRSYGLVDNAAEFYPYPSWKDYGGFCLTSMELDAAGMEGVMMCYDLALVAYTGAMPTGEERTVESLSVEVFDGTQWQEVAKHTSEKGSFGYDRFYVDLSRVAANRKFNIRFNATGKNARSIISWFVAYVRVYEKAKARVSGTVACAGTPVEGAQVQITGSENDVYTAVTNAQGIYSMPDVDADTYTLKASLTGYNSYTEENIKIEKGGKTLDIAMTKPVISLASASQTHTLVAEASAEGTMNLRNGGNGAARASLWVDYGTNPVRVGPAFEAIKTFNTSTILQAAIGFDGDYFYLARSDEYGDALIHRYDRDNSYVGSFTPDINVRRYFGMAFDGQYFFTANGDSIVRIFDFVREEPVGRIVTHIEGICHITYDEVRDAFWVGSLNTLALVDRNGNTLEDEIIYNSEEVLFSGVAYDRYFKDGPCLWIMDRSRGNHPLSSLTKAVIRRIDLNDMEIKDDYAYPCNLLPGFKYGNATDGQFWGEGLFGTTRYKDGHFVLMGVIASNPGLVGVIDMYPVTDWLEIDEYAFDVEASGSKALVYTVNAADMLENQTNKATVTVRMNPYAQPLTYEVTAQVNAKAAAARPLELKATAQNDVAARLDWNAPASATVPASYNIYRNGQKIGSSTERSYTDNNLKYGTHVYAVSAVYAGDKESALSNEVKVEIEAGVPCYAPYGLTAQNVRNREISLTWKDPSTLGMQPVTLRWDNGRNATGIAGTTGTPFIAAVSWSPQDLADYRNMTLASVSFVPSTTQATFTLLLYENDVEVYRQPVKETLVVDQPLKVALTTPYKISDRKELKVGFEVNVTGDGELGIGVDDGPAVDFKGNWLYMEDYGWFTLSLIGMPERNFNIAMELTPKTGDAEAAANSYNVYRNGDKINQSPVTACAYTDPVTTPGVYTYTVTAVHDNGESYASKSARAQIVDVSSHDIPEDLAASVSMNRYVNLHWNYPNMHEGLSKAPAYRPFGYILDFELANSAEAAVVTDGQYIYTAMRNKNGEFNKYSMAGDFIESFTIENVGSVINIAYDGRYFYTSGNSATMYCLDFESRRIVEEISLAYTARHCAYIPELDNGKGGFEVGDWTTSYLVNKSGAFIGQGYSGLDGAYGAAYHNGKIYYAQQGEAGLCEIMEVDLETLQPTGNSVDLRNYTQIGLPSDARSGGLTSFEVANGTAVLIVNIQLPDANNRLVFIESEKNAYISGFNVYRGGEKVNKELVPVREYTDTVMDAGTYNYTVSAVYVDEEESDKSDAVAVKIYEPQHCEAPVDARGTVRGRNVRLQWASVIDQTVPADDMESYTHLATGNVGAWKTIDGDGENIYMSEDLSFAGMDRAKTFFVIDMDQIGESSSSYVYSGKKTFVSFGAWDSENVSKTDDWLITDARTTGGTAVAEWISFLARGLDAGYKESFYVAYSSTTADVADFLPLKTTAERVDYLWTRYTYNLPADAKYVAIHYTSLEGRALFIDDVSLGVGTCPFTVGSEFGIGEEFTEAVAGYYVYRNGQQITPEPIRANAFFDGNLANGEYSYEVKALYNTSCESPKSESVKVKVEYQNPCNAPEGLVADVVGTDVLMSWLEPFYDESLDLTYVKSADMAGSTGWTTATTYYVACKWEPSDLMGVYGYRLDAVAALFYDAPTSLDLLIYQGGELMYEQTVTRECASMEVSVFTLATPYQIDFTKDLMIGFRIEAEAGDYGIIYVSGEADEGYGNLYSDDGTTWYSAYSYTGQWKGNWFLIAALDMALPATGSDLQGYRVYRDGSALNTDLISERIYTDKNVMGGTHTYRVAAVYGSCGEKQSKQVMVVVAGNEGQDKAMVVVSPNPAHETVKVSGQYTRLEILDLQGKVLLIRAAGNDETLDISGLAAGIYMVRISTVSGTQVQKLVVW